MRIEFNVEEIQYIQLTETKAADWYFFNATKEIRKPFLFFWSKVKVPAMKEGYGPEWEPYYSSYYGAWEKPERVIEQDLRKHDKVKLILPRAGSQILEMARVYVQKRHSHHTAYFDTNEEALQFIEAVKAKSKDEFQLITK